MNLYEVGLIEGDKTLVIEADSLSVREDWQFLVFYPNDAAAPVAYFPIANVAYVRRLPAQAVSKTVEYALIGVLPT